MGTRTSTAYLIDNEGVVVRIAATLFHVIVMTLKNFLALLLIYALPLTAHSAEQPNDRIEVVGKKPTYLKNLDGILPIELLDKSAASQSGALAELFANSPQVNFNGQGGLFQTLSIRGMSRWRIQTLVEGVPIHSERRAGNAAEFIAPGFVGNAYVLPGAASTQLGSGALGGGIDMQLVATDHITLNTNYALQQNYSAVQLLGGQEHDNSSLYWGASIRQANNGEDGLNQTLLNEFDQLSGWIRQVSDSNIIKDALLIVSQANDVGKASADPTDIRTTRYPNNDHLLAKIDFDWLNARIYAHNARFDTHIERPNQRTNQLQNQALGWGARIQDSLLFSDWQFNWQLAFDTRNNVNSREQEELADGTLVFDRTNLSARQQAWSLSMDWVRKLREWQIAGGIRTEHMIQHSAIQKAIDTNVSGFVVAKNQWAQNWTSSIYLSSAFRTPTLTERFFSGSTPRGNTVGDPFLKTESAKNIQFDINYLSQNVSFNLSAFKQRIENYIERIALSSSLQQYINLDKADIDGVSYRVGLLLMPNIELTIQGQWLWGEDNTGQSINDVSPHQHQAKLKWQGNGKVLWLQQTYRQEHSRVGSSELPTSSVVHFRAGYEHTISDDLTLQVLANNITDKVYAVSTDDLSPNATGQNIEVNLTYVF